MAIVREKQQPEPGPHHTQGVPKVLELNDSRATPNITLKEKFTLSL